MDFGSCDWLAESACKFSDRVNDDPERVIWISPRCQSDIACLHWFLSEFGGAGVQLIVADYPLLGIATDEPPLRLSGLQEPQIAQLLDSCPRVDWSQSLYPANRWRTLMSEGAFLRIIDGGNIRSVEADYFDHFLLKRCPATWVKGSRVVGDALGDIWDAGHSPDVAFLFWRMRELIQSADMTSDGELPQFGANPRWEVKVRR